VKASDEETDADDRRDGSNRNRPNAESAPIHVQSYVQVCGAANPTVDEARRLLPRPAIPPFSKALLCSTCGVEGNADDDKHDAEHSNGRDKFHGYSSLILKMRRSILQCKTTIPALSKMSPMTAKNTVYGAARSDEERSHPARLMSVTTTMPSQNLR